MRYLLLTLALLMGASTASAESLKDTRATMTHLREVVSSNWTRAQVLRQVQELSCVQIGTDGNDILRCTTHKGSNYAASKILVFFEGRLVAYGLEYIAAGWRFSYCDDVKGNLEVLYGTPAGGFWAFPKYNYSYDAIESDGGHGCTVSVWRK